ncbi:hypothetical protein H6S82_09220 [Planktothrix sp. FACHB-1355]|uniref:Uncharacterized protein n=1 Tax=Aerosakkonema funiforme FACHB-1375 TaxID=2949571 RepID=A0A926VGT9_9CYAN|nr:hypothetical protein [Planktothrix sp. FACHB-1355]MBD2183631.1 hypothetical protein [Aerosakkonema funiforme FACHB-1375]MBD3559037.1 hypothetical protein [Planktothrix sp. FACHB-1355]
MKARLRPLTQPIVWVTIAFLSLVGFFTWAYFNHPEWLALNQEAETPTPSNATADEQTLSDEDKAIGVDIDNLSVLQKEISDSEPLQLTPEEDETELGLFDEFMKQKEAAINAEKSSDSSATEKLTAQPTTANPFALKSESSSNSSTVVSGNSFTPPSSNLGVGSAANSADKLNLPTTQKQNATLPSVSPLQSALDRLGNGSKSSIQTPAGVSVSPLQSALDRQGTASKSTIQNPLQSGLDSPEASSRTGATSPSQASPGNLGQNPTVNQTLTQPTSQLPGQGYGQVSPVPGTTGYGYNSPSAGGATSSNSYTYLNPPQALPGVPSAVQVNPGLAPATPSNLGQSPFQNTAPANGFSNPGFNSNLGNSVTQPSQLQQSPNFSVPRPIPGRHIGGGEINSFSNP